MKIAFIYPALLDAGFNKNNNRITYSAIHPGLCFLSAACKEKGFKGISLIDLRMLSGWEEFKDRVRALKPDVASITLMSPDYKYASTCIDHIKELSPDTKIAVGGMHPTIVTDEMTDNPKIDHIIAGEGEIVFPELLERLKRGIPSERVIKGIRPDVEKLPFIDRELFSCLEIPYDFFLPLPFATILAGRGCPYSCKFCAPASKIMHGNRIRQRSVDNVLEEISSLRGTYGIRSIGFLDDCFTQNKKWVMEFCEKYKKSGFNMPFVCQTRADIVSKNPDMMRALRIAGLRMASIGFESGSDRILKFCNKGTSLKQNLKAARICRSLGIKIWAYNMFGFPTETKKEACDTVRMIRKIKPYRSSAAFFTPHLGSYFYDYCKENSLSLIDAHDDLVRYPELDKPKIKNIDYDFMKKMAVLSKKPSLAVKARIRIERIIYHKINKPFRKKFAEEMRKNPSRNKMAILREMHAAGSI